MDEGKLEEAAIINRMIDGKKIFPEAYSNDKCLALMLDARLKYGKKFKIGKLMFAVEGGLDFINTFLTFIF